MWRCGMPRWSDERLGVSSLAECGGEQGITQRCGTDKVVMRDRAGWRRLGRPSGWVRRQNVVRPRSSSDLLSS